MIDKGLIHVYYGDGKGKTTCGMGLCIRAAGAGRKVLIYQFLKQSDSSELNVLRHIPEITLMDGWSEADFTFRMSDEKKAAAKVYYMEKFEEICSKAREGCYDILFLDEVLHVMNKDMLDEALVFNFLQNKPEKMEVILNGYNPSPALLEMADYVSVIQKEKHPFDKGIPARIGIEK